MKRDELPERWVEKLHSYLLEKKKSFKESDAPDDEMLNEYDFSGGIRGKHYQAYRKGHSVTVNKSDGTVQVQNFTLEDGAVILETNVRKYFPDSESVNRALRGLINLAPTNSKN